MSASEPLIPPHGGYRKLRSFQCARLAHHGTLIFCKRFVDSRSRTYDQMVQAARSGARNIAEGSMASGTSKKSEIKLTGVARASLNELMEDYEDFLAERCLRLWHKDSPEALAVRNRYHSLPRDRSDRSDQSDGSDRSDRSDPSDPSYDDSVPPDLATLSDPYSIAIATPEIAANTLLCLVNQATHLLRRQLESLGRRFVDEGGFTERLYRERQKRRAEQPPSSPAAGGRPPERPPKPRPSKAPPPQRATDPSQRAAPAAALAGTMRLLTKLLRTTGERNARALLRALEGSISKLSAECQAPVRKALGSLAERPSGLLAEIKLRQDPILAAMESLLDRLARS